MFERDEKRRGGVVVVGGGDDVQLSELLGFLASWRSNSSFIHVLLNNEYLILMAGADIQRKDI